MKLKQILLPIVVIMTTFSCGLIASPTPVGAASCGVDTSIIDCEDVGVDEDADTIEQTGLWALLITIINILSAGVGVAAVGGVVYGSFLYTTAGGNPEQSKKGMSIITNTAIGLIAYALMYALLNFLIPGGIFS